MKKYTILVLAFLFCSFAYAQDDSYEEAILADGEPIDLLQGVFLSKAPKHLSLSPESFDLDTVSVIIMTAARGPRPIDAKNFDSATAFASFDFEEWVKKHCEMDDRIVLEVQPKKDSNNNLIFILPVQ